MREPTLMAENLSDRNLSSRGGRLVDAALLMPAVGLPLLVPLYARGEPSLLGFPFFYGFQFILIVAISALTYAAHLASRPVDRRDRTAHGLPPEPDGRGGPEASVDL